MSLQGTLRTLGITEVLEFLADRSATGRLDITADSGSATYWMLRGEVAEVDYEFERESGVDAAESTYYALSELDGTFFFDEGEAPEHGTPTESVADVLGRTADTAEGWSLVEEQIPTPQHQLIRSDALDGSVTIEPEWWRALDAIGSGCSSRTLADSLGMRALAASTMAADMARVGLIVVDEPVADDAPLSVSESISYAEDPVMVEPAPAVAEPTPEPPVEFSVAPIADDESAAAPSGMSFGTDSFAADAFESQPESFSVAPEPAMAAPAPEAPAQTPEAWTTTPDVPVMAEPEPAPTWDTAPAEPEATTSWDVPPAPAPEAAPVADAAPAGWDTTPEPQAVAWDTPEPAPEAAAAWDTAEPAPEPAAAWPAAAPAPTAPEPAPVAAAPAPANDDDGWATDHSAAPAASAPAEANDAAAALASWGAAAATPSMAPSAPAPEPVAAAPAHNPFADLPSEADLAAPPPAPAPAPVMETAPAGEPTYQTPPTQAAVFGSAPPAPSPYAPDAAPIEPAPIAPPVGTVDELAPLAELDDVEDEDFGTDDRSSVLKFLRRD